MFFLINLAYGFFIGLAIVSALCCCKVLLVEIVDTLKGKNYKNELYVVLMFCLHCFLLMGVFVLGSYILDNIFLT